MSVSEASRVNHGGLAQPVDQAHSEDKKEILAAIYARTSSPNQRFGYSLDEQIELCRERCELMGWTVRYMYREDGISAKDTDRPKFKVLLERAMLGRFDVIVFWKLDRFCRSLLDLMNTEKMLDEWGVALHSITEQIDTTTPVGKFNFRNLASAAELERELIKERSRMGMHALAKQHKWPNKNPPLGYDKAEDGKLKPNTVGASLVNRIFGMYLEHRSMPQIAFILNKEGVKTRPGKNWTARAVKNILDNEIYIGNYSVAGVNDYVEEYRIVDDDLFDEIHKLREKSKRIRKEMPKERKEATIDKIFNEYLEYLRESEETGEFKIV